MANSQDKKASLESLLDGIVLAAKEQNQQTYDEIQNDQQVIDAIAAARCYDYEMFDFELMMPFDQVADSVIQQITDDEDAAFILRHSDFLDSHLSQLFIQVEDSPCSADKSRTLIRAVLEFHMTSRPIKFNYDSEYTGHLPATILKEHDQIVAFFGAMRALYYGRSHRYVVQLGSLLSTS